jgi:tetratricopeptide (TPR) repeat protein
VTLSRGEKTGIAAAIAALIALALVSGSRVEHPTIPDPATDAMEPQVAEKIVAARKRVSDEPASAGAWGRLGMVFHAHYLESEAASCYSEAHRLDPEDFRWPYLLARVLQTADADRALAALSAARRLRPDYAPLHLLAAEILEGKGDSEGARDSYRRALSSDAGSASAEFGLGRLALAEGDLEESAMHVERAAELAPEAGSIQATLSRLYQRLGREAEAIEAAGRARRLHPDLDERDPILASVMEEAVSLVGYQNRAVEAERSGDPLRAEALHRRAIELRPSDASLHYNLGNHLSRQGRLLEAEEIYRQVLSLDAGHAAAMVNLGILVAQRGDLREAARLFGTALEADPSHPGALLGLGNVAEAEGSREDAVLLFQRSVAADPDRPDAHYALARAFAAQGRSDEAIEHFQKALEGAPEKGEIHLELAALYGARGDYGAAERHVAQAKSLGMEPPREFLSALERLSKAPK